MPLLKALMCGTNAVGAEGSGCMVTLCHAPLKMEVLLHKMASVCKQALMTVCFVTKIIVVLLVKLPYFKTFSSITFEQIGADE